MKKEIKMKTREELLKLAEEEGWDWISIDQNLSESFIKEFQDKVDWNYISEYQILSESFIKEFQDKVDWERVSEFQILSENFIKEFQDKVDWNYISIYQNLSEDFIKEFQDKINWNYISQSQNLSEDFIKEFQDKVDWYWISIDQNLSEDFIKEFQDKVDWYWISKFQKLSEDFIREFKDKVNWNYISIYQNLSESSRKDFRKEFVFEISKDCWLYKTKKEKLKYIKENTDYKVVNNEYILAYKSTRIDGTSVYNNRFQYKVGKVYEDFHCNCNQDEENSFGLSVWTKEGALEYYDSGKLFLVKIWIDDVGVIVHENSKIRCWKLEVLEDVEK